MLGERLVQTTSLKLFLDKANEYGYQPLIPPLLESGLSIQQINNIKKTFNDILSLDILYDSNNDEKTSKVCHEKIDLKGPTITLIQNGTVFFFIWLIVSLERHWRYHISKLEHVIGKGRKIRPRQVCGCVQPSSQRRSVPRKNF